VPPAALVFSRHASGGSVTFAPLPTSPLHWSEAARRGLLAGIAGFFLLVGGGFVAFIASNIRGEGPPWPVYLCPAVPFGSLSSFFLILAIAPGRRSGYPITASRDGKLLSGGWVLCRRAVSVRIERGKPTVRPGAWPTTAEEACHLYVEDEGGRFVELPTPAFSPLPGPQLASELAAWLGEALGAPVLDQPPPTEWSRPDREARWRHGCSTVPLFVIGIPHFLGGVTVVGVGPWYFGLIFVATGAFVLYLGVRRCGGRVLTWWFLVTALASVVALGWALASWQGRNRGGLG
jgi:hypothetical protein